MRAFNRFYWVATALVAALAACGGGGSTSTPITLGGTAAVGSPIVAGSIQVSCAGGAALTTTTSTTGTWQVATSGQTLPCAVQVSGGTVGGVANTTPYHSVALAFGTVNVTPLTDLVVAQLTGSAPQTWFASPAFAAVNSGAISTALTALNNALGITATLGNLNPLTSGFTAATGNPMDNTLQALKTALTAQSQTYAALLSAIESHNFAAFSGFSTQLASAYSALATSGSGSGGTGGSGTCSGGQTMLTYQGNADLYAPAQTLCVQANATTLTLPSKSLSNPYVTPATAPYSIYSFTDGIYVYEVVFNNGVVMEINFAKNSVFLGTFM